MENNISAVYILNGLLEKYHLEMLDIGNSLSLAIYEYFSSKDFNDSENALTKQYIASFNSWESLLKYGISRGEFKVIDIHSIFDYILISRRRMYSRFMKINDYNEWLNRVILNSNAETVSSDWVLTDTFFAIREYDKKIVGIVDLRYQLNEFINNFGHCGYSVRPTGRNKGYAKEMLTQICQKAKTYGLKRL